MSRFDPARLRSLLTGLCIIVLAAACSAAPTPPPGPNAIAVPNVLAVETFLADMAQHVAGERLRVQALMPIGVDPHNFEPAPADIVRVSASTVLIVNGAGFEGFLNRLLQNAGGQRLVIEAAAGLTSRAAVSESGAAQDHPEGDPHFWLDPILAVHYVENIRDGLSQADAAGASVYAANAAAYIADLQALDAWIRDQVSQAPPAARQLVTNHESLGYFADRYGFQVIGAIIPSVSTGAAPSAQQLAGLIDHIRATGARAIFLEAGANPQLADQVAAETGVRVVTGLLTHSLSAAGGEGATYIEMMKFNTRTIVAALKQ
ncbi:metal ABC transporter substrate-binding protein [Candidatus Amarolinea aalborgensis]|uniref:metal ABC transporter substrate-binding protein n=1 Tax=Candidatus Amarolinea aalborgensis TaxID=2249329 RepID=UPI003BFA26BF